MPRLGPFSTVVGLTPELLKSDGPFPAVHQEYITIGLVIELFRFAKVSRLDISHACHWLISLGTDSTDTTPYVLGLLASKRDHFRRYKQTQNILDLILESKQFNASEWSSIRHEVEEQQPSEPVSVSVSTPSPRDLEHQRNLLAHEISQKEKHVKRLRSEIEDEKQDLQSIKKLKSHNTVRNINKRLKRQKERNRELRKENIRLLKENSTLRKKVSVLNKEKLNIQRKLWKVKRKINAPTQERTECASCDKLTEILKLKEEHILCLESKLLSSSSS